MQALINIAVEELCETANSLLAPVIHGVVRPTAPFNLTSTSDFVAVEELFSVEPLAPRQDRSSASRSSSTATTPAASREPSQSRTGSDRTGGQAAAAGETGGNRSRTRSATYDNILQRVRSGSSRRSALPAAPSAGSAAAAQQQSAVPQLIPGK